MSLGEPLEVSAQDAADFDAYVEALREFSAELVRLHVTHGAPSYAVIAAASFKPKLTKAGINEALSGKRLPSLDATMEFVRVVSSPLPSGPDASRRVHPELAAAWRQRWQDVKLLQKRAQAPRKRIHVTAQGIIERAQEEAAAIRAEAQREADRIRAEAQEEADRIRAEAHTTAERTLADAQTEEDRRSDNARGQDNATGREITARLAKALSDLPPTPQETTDLLAVALDYIEELSTAVEFPAASHESARELYRLHTFDMVKGGYAGEPVIQYVETPKEQRDPAPRFPLVEQAAETYGFDPSQVDYRLGSRPAFNVALRGYDRAQVDEYFSRPLEQRDPVPIFNVAMRGYDRSQVDLYLRYASRDPLLGPRNKAKRRDADPR
ncbi:hypothetical protein E0500_030220 [Streptomyces sp. KM273126]|uniref:hypothetical protein n=1 Tax=Streptomyces sp. KM273126 TaxID=2545247 RepID=UPI0015EB6A5F|nr:hypothetical protein [Streptomyces sp. KM273126]MBA2811497.1 hypothetical protein [Streptomyces sp. KM273126]